MPLLFVDVVVLAATVIVMTHLWKKKAYRELSDENLRLLRRNLDLEMLINVRTLQDKFLGVEPGIMPMGECLDELETESLKERAS